MTKTDTENLWNILKNGEYKSDTNLCFLLALGPANSFKLGRVLSDVQE